MSAGKPIHSIHRLQEMENPLLNGNIKYKIWPWQMQPFNKNNSTKEQLHILFK